MVSNNIYVISSMHHAYSSINVRGLVKVEQLICVGFFKQKYRIIIDESCYQNWNIVNYELRQLNGGKIVHLLRIQGHMMTHIII